MKHPCRRYSRTTADTDTRSSSAGFTLVELLIVIGIVALLAGILVPAFFIVREKGRTTSCAGGMRQIGMAILQYSQDFDERSPVTNVASAATGQMHLTNTGWAGQIMPYVKSTGVFRCPDDPTACSPIAAFSSTPYPVSYAINPNIIASGGSTGLASPAKTILLFEVADDCAQITESNEGDIPGPAGANQLSAAGDGVNGSLSNLTVIGQGPPIVHKADYATGVLANGDLATQAEESINQFADPDPRHGSEANYVAADGHVQSVAPNLVSAGGNALAPANEEAGLGCKVWRTDVPPAPYPCAAGTANPVHELTFSGI